MDTTGLNIAADGVRTVALLMALHTADPGSGASNEVSGGGYVRQSVSWASASGGVALQVAPADFDVPAGTVAWITIWNAGGTIRYAKAQLSSDAVFPVAGVLTISGCTITFASA